MCVLGSNGQGGSEILPKCRISPWRQVERTAQGVSASEILAGLPTYPHRQVGHRYEDDSAALFKGAESLGSTRLG